VVSRRGADERLVTDLRSQSLGNDFLWSKTAFQQALEARRDPLYSHQMVAKWKRPICRTRDSNTMAMDTELKTLISDLQRQLSVISMGKIT
jgi:hypothetical protein